jgi:hypothetical protein
MSTLAASTDAGAQAIADILKASWNEVADEAEHAIRLESVISAYVVQVERHEQEAARRQQLLCPICGQSDEAMGVPDTRDVVSTGIMREGGSIKLRSCVGCYLAAVDRFTQLHTTTPLSPAGGKTRAQLVAEHFRQAGVM